MLKYLIYFACTWSLCLGQPNPTTIAKQFCNTINCQANQSIACQYVVNPNIKCDGKIQILDQNAIVEFHNEKRNDIALGNIPRYDAAVRMETMQWSPELAQMAEYNVKTCKFAHDKCRNTNRFPQSGQNLYLQWNSASDNSNINDVVLSGLESWFEENKDADMSYIRRYRPSPQQIGHFTVMVKQDNNYIGCALNKYTDNETNNINYLMACNYAKTNIIGRPIYEAGVARSKCPNGTNPWYYGLCKAE